MLRKFDTLMSHLNSEDNDMATKFRNELSNMLRDIELNKTSLEFLECLKACGVDNWSGYDEAVQMMWPEDE